MVQCDEEKLSLIALSWGACLGPATIRRLCDDFGSAIATLNVTPAQLADPVFRLNPDNIQQMGQLKNNLDKYQTQLAQLEKHGITVITQSEPQYPKVFTLIQNPPSVICIKGHLPGADVPTVGIVGTRKPTLEGYQASHHFAVSAIHAGYTVISGLALGCDTAAHEGALAAGGNTIAILGSGILCPYPPQNKFLFEQIFSAGALISEQPPEMKPYAGALMARNRLISALSQVIVIIQAGAHGGALETARQANLQQKRLFAVDWPANILQSQGTKRLINAGIAEPIAPEQAIFPVESVFVGEKTNSQKCNQLTLF